MSYLTVKSSYCENNFRFRVRLWEIVLRAAKLMLFLIQLMIIKNIKDHKILCASIFLLPFSATAVIRNESFNPLDLGTLKRKCYPLLPIKGFVEQSFKDTWSKEERKSPSSFLHGGTRHRISFSATLDECMAHWGSLLFRRAI